MSRPFDLFATRLLNHAASVMPPVHRDWVGAMRVELDHIPDPVAALAFALGCVRASYAQRIEDMMTLAALSRWTLAGLALAWAGFSALAAALLVAIKSNSAIKPADLGTDPGTDLTLRFIQSYPAWQIAIVALVSALLAIGAVQLARRRPQAFVVLAAAVGMATFLALLDLRLPDPGADRPMDSVVALLTPLIFLAPVWWLSRRAPDLTPAA